MLENCFKANFNRLMIIVTYIHLVLEYNLHLSSLLKTDI